MDSKFTLNVGQLNLPKFPLNTKTSFELTEENAPWVAALLNELNENAHEKTPEQWIQETYIDMQLELTKRFNNEMGELLLAKVEFSTEYATECVRTLKTMKETLELEFRACFLPEELAKSEDYAEIDEIFQEGEVYELYYYSKNQVDLQEMIHEQVFLHYNPYPILDPDSQIDGGIDGSSSLQ